MPRLARVGVDLLAAYLTLSIVAGFGFEKGAGRPSETWTIIGLVAAGLVFLALEWQAHRQRTGRGPDQRG